MVDSTPEHFDIIIIGTGSGNSLPDERFADKKIAICEEWVFGGTCLNRGCIPTKMFVYAADQAEHAASNAHLGIDTSFNGVRWSEIVSRVFADRIDLISAGGRRYRVEESPNITVFEGHASFVGERTIDTGTGAIISGDVVVLAAGARSAVPEFVTDAGVDFDTSDTVMRIPALPESMLIVGSGFIAAEFAHVFSSFGVDVTITGRSPVLLKHTDATIARAFTEAVSHKWDVRVGCHTTALRRGDGGTGVHAEFSDGSQVDAEALLVATGRDPNGDRLNAAAGGVDVVRGRVVVDEFGRTSAPGVWALGDVSSPYQLKHVANHELRVVQHNLLNPDDLRAFHHDAVPYAVFSSPQVAAVGLTEAEARDAGYDVTVKVQQYGDVAYGWAMHNPVGLCKIIADRATATILGAHILGEHASMLIQPLVQAMTCGLTVPQMARGQYWIHPALTEVVENALLGLDFPDRGF